MVITCLAAGCKNESNVHPFPLDYKRRKQWILFLEQEVENFNIEIHFKPALCNDHFARDCITNLIEVQAGLARVCKLKPDAVPTIHKKLFPPKPTLEQNKTHHSMTVVSKTSPKTKQKSLETSEKAKSSISAIENASKTKIISTCKICLKNVFGSLKAHLRKQHRLSLQEYTKQHNVQKPQSNISAYQRKNLQLIKQNITECSQMGCIPPELSVKLKVTSTGSGGIVVENINKNTAFEETVKLLCNTFRMLLHEQNLGVIAGRLSAPTDRIVRMCHLPHKHILSLRNYYSFRTSKNDPRWPNSFNDVQLVRALVFRITHYFNKEADSNALQIPLWKPIFRMQRYTGLMQEHLKVVKSEVPILG